MSAPKANDPAYWTPEKKHEWKIRGEADLLCRQGEYNTAMDVMAKAGYDWPPYKTTAVQPKLSSPLFIGPKPFDRRKITNVINGQKGGAPIGNTNNAGRAIYIAAPESTENLIDDLKNTLLTTGVTGIKTNPKLMAMTANDRVAIQRLTGQTAEEFNSRLAEKLGSLADELVDSLRDDIANGRLKPGEKAFPMAVAIDKRNILDGRSQLQNAAVNIQVNNFNGRLSKAEIMARLSPVNIAPEGEPAKPAIDV